MPCPHDWRLMDATPLSPPFTENGRTGLYECAYAWACRRCPATRTQQGVQRLLADGRGPDGRQLLADARQGRAR